jgi:hypothetical protein
VNTRVSTVTLDASDAYELIELLQLINDWLRIDYHRHRASLDDNIGYDLDNLRDDLARFTFLLGGDHDLLDGDRR